MRAGYGKRVAIDEINLQIGDGIIAVVGPNGGGKSTLLKVMTTLLSPSSGQLRICGHPIRGRADRRRARRSIGFLEQDARFPAELRTVDCLEYAAWLLHVPPNERPAAAVRALGDYDLLEVAQQRIGTLSGGTRQRLMLAAASIHRPALLVLDEPTSGVDPVHRAAIQALLRAAQIRAVVVSTHHIDDIVAFADRIVVVAAGRVRFDGSLRELERRGNPGAGDRIESVQSALLALGAGSPTSRTGSH